MSWRAIGIAAGATMVFACGSADRSSYTIAAAGPWQLPQGRNTRLGIALAIREINEAGGIQGHRLQLRDADDEADGRKAAQVAQRFVDDPTISAVVGHVTSGAMVAAAKVYDGHLSAVATAASSPDLTGISPWVFRVISSDSANGIAMARFAARLGRRRAVILYENDNYGRGLADAFRRGFPGEIISFDPINSDSTNAELFVSYIKLKQPDIVFVAGLAGSGLALLTEARRQSVSADFMGGDGWTSLTYHADIAEGVYVGAPFTPSDRRPAAQKFVAAFRAANGGAEPDGNAALAYDATRVIAAALGAVGPDRARIRGWLAGLDKSMDGVTGPIRFLRSGDPAGKSITVTRVGRGGTLVVAGTTP
ncbi:MAG TPA: branched-chain amino acid ABC transporter substrate-binding protein [Gemmatimonadaceae bacterium]|nr:branched-chain amino acid ABC transporter substrate-binding protein [Gemmatimonadaceae bacterium]